MVNFQLVKIASFKSGSCSDFNEKIVNFLIEIYFPERVKNFELFRCQIFFVLCRIGASCHSVSVLLLYRQIITSVVTPVFLQDTIRDI